MKSTIDPAGRVVIPKAFRDRLGLGGGHEIDIRERDGCIEIEAASTPMILKKRGRLRVAVPRRKLPPLTDDIVRTTLEKVRR